MTGSWREHPKLVVWFDDLEDAVTTSFSLTQKQRSEVRVIRAPRHDTWIMLAKTAELRDVLRQRLSEVPCSVAVPVAEDCDVLSPGEGFVPEADTFEQDHGFDSIVVDYVEEASLEELRRELLSDADDYAASDEVGWFYGVMDGEYDTEGDEPRVDSGGD